MTDVQPQAPEHAPSKTLSGWAKWHDWNVRAMQPSTELICQALALRPGQRVLDLACGTGNPALAIAARVRPGGTVIATDISPEMVAGARQYAERAGIAELDVRLMNAQEIDFPEASFDGVSCAQGLMFCPDPVATMAEVRRVLVPGGRFAVTAWDVPEKNPFFTTLFQTIGRFVPPPPPDPKARGMFGLAPAVEFERVVRAAGFEEFSVQSFAFEIAFESLEQHWQMFSDVAPPAKAAKSTLSPGELARLRDALNETLAPYVRGGELRLSATTLCATGRK